MSRILVTILLLASTAAAQHCVDYREFLRLAGNTPTAGSARDVVVRGDIAFLANGPEGFAVLDVSNPAQPRYIANDPLPGTALWLAVHDDVAYVASILARVHVYDVSDPYHPEQTALVNLPGAALDFAWTGPHLLLAAGQAGLLVLDLDDPLEPVLVGSIPTSSSARGVDVSGNLAAVADDGAGLVVIDISEPRSPRLVGQVATLGDAYAVALDGPVAMVAAWSAGLEIFDLTVPSAPAPISQLTLPGVARDLRLRDGLAFVAAGGLSVVDVALPDLPRLVGLVGTAANAVAVGLADGHAYVATGAGGLDVVDIDPPTSPPRLSLTAVDGVAFAVDTHGPLSIVGAENLSVIDHSDPTDPVLLGTMVFPGNASRLAAFADRVYLTTAGTGGSRLVVADISTPADPTMLADYQLDTFAGPVCVHGSVVYLADFFFGGLMVVDVTDPTRPDLLTTVATRPFAQHLTRIGEHLVVGTGAFGGAALQIFDVADPLQSVLVDERLLDAESVQGLTAAGDLLLSTVLFQGGTGELVIMDATDPENLQPLSALPFGEELHDVVVHGETAYVTTFLGFVHVVDIADPTAPACLGQAYLPDSAFVLALSDQGVHAATTDAGLAILPLHCGAVVSVEDDEPGPDVPSPSRVTLTAAPNPFNPRVVFALALPRAATVRADVFDVAGHRVAQLVGGRFAAGVHEFVWDGRDGRGQEAPSGVYLARFRGAGFERTVRVALVR